MFAATIAQLTARLQTSKTIVEDVLEHLDLLPYDPRASIDITAEQFHELRRLVRIVATAKAKTAAQDHA